MQIFQLQNVLLAAPELWTSGLEQTRCIRHINDLSFCYLTDGSTYSEAVNPYMPTATMTSLKRIFEVNVCPW